MTPEQEQIAETLILELKHKKGQLDWKRFRDDDKIDPDEMSIVIRSLKELSIIESISSNLTIVRLTEEVGWSFPGFEAQRHIEQKRKEQKDKFEELDFKKKSWEYKYRITPYLFSSLALTGTVISLIISYKSLTKKSDQPDLQPMKEQIQILQAKMKLLDSLYQVDTLRKKHNE